MCLHFVEDVMEDGGRYGGRRTLWRTEDVSEDVSEDGGQEVNLIPIKELIYSIERILPKSFIAVPTWTLLVGVRILALFHRIYCQRYLKRKLFFMLKYLNKCSFGINAYRQRRIRNIPSPIILRSGDRVIPGRNNDFPWTQQDQILHCPDGCDWETWDEFKIQPEEAG